MHRWKAPSPGWFTVNWLVVRDHMGLVHAAHGFTREGFFDPTDVEALATIFDVQLCRDLDLRKIQLEGDAKMVVEAVVSNENDGSHRGHLIDE